MTEEIQPMADGGVWLAQGSTGTPHYVVNPDHINRMLAEGYQIIDESTSPS
jgi:hypothetical protein